MLGLGKALSEELSLGFNLGSPTGLLSDPGHGTAFEHIPLLFCGLPPADGKLLQTEAIFC